MPEKVCGIYCIENIIDNKKYIGQSVELQCREKRHLKELKSDKNASSILQNAFNKYGEESFIFYIVEYCTVDFLDEREIYYIKEWHTHFSEWGYNISFGGKTPMRGRKHSDETKKKMSDICPDYSGENNPMYGKKHTEESRQKISVSHIGKKLSEESKRKVSNFQKGKKKSKEAIEKTANAHKGMRFSEESKKKMSDSQKGRHVGENNVNAKITEKDVKEIRNMIEEGISVINISKILNISKNIIYNIKNGKSWKNVK